MAATAAAAAEARRARRSAGTTADGGEESSGHSRIRILKRDAVVRMPKPGDGCCLLRLRMPKGNAFQAWADDGATTGELLALLSEKMGMLPAEGRGKAHAVAAHAEEFTRKYGVWVREETSCQAAAATAAAATAAAAAAADDAHHASAGIGSVKEGQVEVTPAALAVMRELVDDETQPTLHSAGLGERCMLLVRPRYERAPLEGDFGSLPEEWKLRASSASKSPGAPQERADGAGTSGGGGSGGLGCEFGRHLDAFLSELNGVSRQPSIAVTLPGGRLTGMLHGQYRFDDTAFERAGMLVILCESADEGDFLLAELQPLLRFQSMAFVLPERTSAGKLSTPEQWADDIGELLT